MRMRRKPYARPELAATPFNVAIPPEHYGRWHEMFVRELPVYLELGCGKGYFVSTAAANNPNVNYIAIDIKSEVLVCAKRRIEKVFSDCGRDVDNVLIMSHDIMRIDMIFAPSDTVDRIYINFPNPWPKDSHKKRRLTHPKQLIKYREFLRDGGEIYFKTDDDELFSESLEYFKDTGFSVEYITYDLHNENRDDNIETEHEKMFSEQGIPIKMLIARK